MFEKIKVKKTKKPHIKGKRKELINCECPGSSDKNDDILPVVKGKKKNIQLESTGEDLTVKCDTNATTASLPVSADDSKKTLKKNKRKLETEADDINIIVKCTIEQTVDRTNKISKKKGNPTDNDVNIVDDKKGVAVKNEKPVETPSSLNVKAKRKKKKKKSGGNEIIDEHDVNIVDDKKGVAVKNEIPVDETLSSLNVKPKKKKKKKSGGNETIIDEYENKELDEFIGELDEESNAQYDNWVKQIDSIFRKSM